MKLALLHTFDCLISQHLIKTVRPFNQAFKPEKQVEIQALIVEIKFLNFSYSIEE